MMPKRKASFSERVEEEQQKWLPGQKRRQERINQQKSAKETENEGKQAEAANQEPKIYLWKMGDTKNEEGPASDEAGEKEAKSD